MFPCAFYKASKGPPALALSDWYKDKTTVDRHYEPESGSCAVQIIVNIITGCDVALVGLCTFNHNYLCNVIEQTCSWWPSRVINQVTDNFASSVVHDCQHQFIGDAVLYANLYF